MKFSIITPNYKSGDMLLRAHQSLLPNKCGFEHIVIDDFSQDDSLRCLIESGNQKNLVPIWLDKNAGPGHARNQGLSIASGEYILFLDADDYFEPVALDDLEKLIYQNDKPDLIVFDYFMIKTSKTIASKNTSELEILNQESLLKDFMLDKIVSSPWCKCIKADIAKKYQFPNLRVQEDSLYNFSIFSLCRNAIYLHKPLYNFDKSFSGSLTTKDFTKCEMLRFYKSWIAFEKLVNQSGFKDKSKLLAIRKIKFCSFYYMNRLSVNQSVDPFIVGVIKKTFSENIFKALPYLSKKGLVVGIAFILVPRFTLKLIRRMNG